MKRRRKKDGGVVHLPDFVYVGPNLDVPSPPDELPYGDRDDYRSEQVLAVNGIDPTEDGVVEALSTQEGLLLAAAAHTAGARQMAGSAPALRQVTEGGDEQAAVEAAFALARLGHADAADRLRAVAQQPIGTSLGPVLAAGYLARLADPAGYSSIAEAQHSDSLAIRMLATKQAFAFVPFDGQVDVGKLFERALHDKETSIQGEALVQLGDLHWPPARPLLDDFAARTRDRYLKRLAEAALASLG